VEDKQMKLQNILFISILLITTACTSTQAGGGELPIPSTWKLVSFGKAGAETRVVQGMAVTLEFAENGQLGGNGGCNSYGGMYEVQGSKLKILEIISTLMACANDQVMQQESQYFSALQSATGFEISGDKLTIYDEDGRNQLNFVKQ
jgi:heat shock protein HslJ